jgi:methylmalonyl-CoA mutase N-terminal domain/subunit
VNTFTVEDEPEPDLLAIDPDLEPAQCRALSQRRAQRDDAAVAAALVELNNAAEGTENVLYPMKTALQAGATIGDITATLVPVFGRYRPTF